MCGRRRSLTDGGRLSGYSWEMPLLSFDIPEDEVQLLAEVGEGRGSYAFTERLDDLSVMPACAA
jgi:hypothetical protein